MGLPATSASVEAELKLVLAIGTKQICVSKVESFSYLVVTFFFKSEDYK